MSSKKQVFIALEVLNLTGSETQTLVLGHIAYHHAKHGAFNSSVSAIAKYLNYSVNAVKNALHALTLYKDEHGQPLIHHELQDNYNRKIRLNAKHALGFKLVQSYTRMVMPRNPNDIITLHINLYSVSLDLYQSEHRYDSRHQHKMLVLKSLITAKIESNLLNSKNRRNTYSQTVQQLAEKLGWAAATIQALISSMIKTGLISVVKERVESYRGLLYIFGIITSSRTKRKSPLTRTPRPS